ncbi:MAG: HlyD family efflux transporter periplasmic adaptor subunit [Rudaea sp.]
MSALFRSEVIDAKRGEWLGAIRLATPLSHRVLTACALALGAALVAFVVSGHYTRRERTSGTLVPSAGLIELPASSAGMVTRVFAEQGTLVHAGDSLVALSADHMSSALGDTAVVVAEQLKLQRARVDADIADQQKLQQDRAGAIEERIAAARAQLVQVDGQLSIQQQQARNARNLLARFQPLWDKGYISALQVQQQEATALEAEAQSKALARQRIDAQQQIGMQQEQLRQLPLSAAAQRHESERKRADLDQSLAQNELTRSAVLRAPQDAIVSSVLVKPGQAVAAGQVAIALVPNGSDLEAVLLVPSRAIGFVEPGNVVVLRYEAYPYQKFGLHAGRVKSVSHSALSPAQITGLSGQPAGEAMYRVAVQLDTQAVDAYGRQEALKPGMALEADILLDRRRLIEWVLEPLYGVGRQLAADP